MAEDILVEKLAGIVNDIIKDDTQYFLVSIKIKPTNNVKVYLDGDNGITIEKCIQINRKMAAAIEETGILPSDNFSLEVSSPGIDSPLVLHRQYVKNKGRLLEVTLTDEAEILGKLIEVTEQNIVLEVTSGKGKKAVTEQKEIPFDQIKKAVVQIQF
ncbi:MAG: ribosome maturation factor [Pseudopedobacter saltans]|uniref:Ribosome maturation factor RimP n=1 Tax=Pseudopedobacter saltans TaxID=151895 RepID=A0A2W5F744_9SPHI|nr:MAG: ribosome maturation factor [Pseudopedobacter saltans]